MSDVLYEVSQGITDLAVKLYMFAQERPIDTGKEVVTANVIRSVARDKFVMLRDVLTALRNNNKGALARWDDVYPHALKEYLESLSQNGPRIITMEGNVASAPDIQTATSPSGKPSPPPLAPPSALDSASTVIALVAGRNAGPPSRKSAKPAAQRKPILPNIVKSGLKNRVLAYDALKQNGYIKGVSEFLE